MKSLITVFLLLVLFNLQAAERIHGTWQSDRFQFNFIDSMDLIEGYHGSKNYEISILKNINTIYGKINKKKFDVTIRNGSVNGELICGRISIYYNEFSYTIDGTICGRRLQMASYNSKKELLEAVKELVIGEIVVNTPRPIRGAVRSFLLLRVVF